MRLPVAAEPTLHNAGARTATRAAGCLATLCLALKSRGIDHTQHVVEVGVGGYRMSGLCGAHVL
jgi:hypothetical protein